jgi:acyl-CoA reductase-like NAD-dependent aldehyde dehydrogenase
MTNTIELNFKKNEVNPALLVEELKPVLGDSPQISTGAGKVRVYVPADTPQNTRDQVGTVIAAHNAKQLTAEQQAQADQAAQLAALKQKTWAEWTAQDKDTLLQFLFEQMEFSLPEAG